MSIGTPPSWISGAIFYQIFPDRFAKSSHVLKPHHLEDWDSPPTTHGFKGGDLLGVSEHLDYLEDLGINAIYFNPIFQSSANHRYHTYSYSHIDPILGGDEAFRTLLTEAHRRGIHIVLDGVFNHTGRGFFQFNHILENGPASPYLDWFHIRGFPLRAYDGDTGGNYACWWGLCALPKLNTDNPDVREFLWNIGRYWIEQGIDGWRLDVPGEIDDDAFWHEFRKRVKGANPDAYIVGEIWGDATPWLISGQFDATMNYLFARAAMGYFLADTFDENLTAGLSYAPVPRLDGPGFRQEIDNLLGLYPGAVNRSQLNLLDSHDTARLLSLARGDERAVMLAVLFQMTYVGAPCVYYGDEIGMTGGRDPDCRRSMIWDSARWNTALHDAYRRYIKLRRERRALTDGDYRPLHAEGRVFIFGRRFETETVVVALNSGRNTVKLNVPVGDYVPEGAVLRQVWTGEILRVMQGKLMNLMLPPQTGAVFDVVPQE
jgi:cyclomaltodextrinase / maltogenic alpha-amylase / neopullulanase